MVLICGLPNAGKTTYSARYSPVIHFDSVGCQNVDDHFSKCAALAAQADGDVYVEGVYSLQCRRMELLDAVRDKPYRKVCIWIDTPADVCRSRERRGRPDLVVDRSSRKFQPPTLDEGWDEIIRIDGTLPPDQI